MTVRAPHTCPRCAAALLLTTCGDCLGSGYLTGVAVDDTTWCVSCMWCAGKGKVPACRACGFGTEAPAPEEREGSAP
jgi:hypothetical protein